MSKNTYVCQKGSCKRKIKKAGLKHPRRLTSEGFTQYYSGDGAKVGKGCTDGRCYEIALEQNELMPTVDSIVAQESPQQTENTVVTKSEFKQNDRTGVLTANITTINALADPKAYLTSKGLDPDEYTVGSGKVNSWTTTMKIKKGGVEIPTQIENFQICVPFIPKKIDPIKYGIQVVRWDAEPDPYFKGTERVYDNLVERVLVIPDIHFGYRTVDGVDVPTHDERALNIVLDIIQECNPDRIVMLGDTMDFPEFGRHVVGKDLQGNTQKSILAATLWLSKVRVITDCPIDLLEGNHDKRPTDYVREELKKLANVPGLKVKLPSLVEMLDLEGKNITYHGGPSAEGYDGYSSGKSHFIHRSFVYMHGEKHGKDAVQQTMNLWKNHSICMGHIHKQTTVSEQVPDVSPETGQIVYTRRWGVSPGMLGVQDATLPGVSAIRNYQQGLTLITHVAEDESWSNHQDLVTQIPICNGVATYNDKIFRG